MPCLFGDHLYGLNNILGGILFGNPGCRRFTCGTSEWLAALLPQPSRLGSPHPQMSIKRVVRAFPCCPRRLLSLRFLSLLHVSRECLKRQTRLSLSSGPETAITVCRKSSQMSLTAIHLSLTKSLRLSLPSTLSRANY